MTISAVFINPNMVVLRADPLTTGVVYMPVGLASVVASVRNAGLETIVIDAFGAAPKQGRLDGKFLVLGLTYEQVLSKIPSAASAVCIYANQLINHMALVDLIKACKDARQDLPIIVLENTQAVTAYELRSVASELISAGVDWILMGEAEERLPLVIKALTSENKHEQIKKIAGLQGRETATPMALQISNLDRLPFPAWDLFPLENYWSLRFSHGPQSTKRYLPLLTSRGCPYPCRFCVVPATNQRKWRGRSAVNVVDEIQYLQARFGVEEFHVEDLNPTVNDKRTRAICEEILARNLKIHWKLVAGTKVETIRDEQTIELMACAGCRYISISPESGSPRVMKLINKPFDIEHAIQMIHHMNRVGIKSQACFVLGYPGEMQEDRLMTRDMVKRLTREGVDEIALFIISPVPGSELYSDFKGYQSLSDLNFTPSWRSDFSELSKFRLNLYANFLFWKLRYYPQKILRQIRNFLLRRFETKMEMVPYKAAVWKWVEYRHV